MFNFLRSLNSAKLFWSESHHLTLALSLQSILKKITMKKILFFAITIASLSSCKNLVPYSDSIRQKYHLTEDDLKRVQFYVSDPITLQRKFVDGSAQITSGKLKLINGEKVEEVQIPSATPGILVREADGGKLEVSFEKSNDYFLRFGYNPNKSGTYVLLASEWKNKVGNLSYGGQKFYTSPESGDALLLIDMKKIVKYSKTQRVASGRKVE